MTNIFQNLTARICLVFSILALGGCGLARQQAWESAYQKAEAAEQQCDQMKNNRIFKKWSEVSDCYDKTVWPIYTQANYPNPDLLELLFTKYRVIDEQMDTKKISVSDGKLQKKQAKVEINNMIAQRAGVAAQVASANAAKLSAATAIQKNIQDNFNANRPRTCTGYGNSVTCY